MRAWHVMSAGTGLSAEEAAAVRMVALGFRGGAPLRTVLDAAETAHGAAGWARPAAQQRLLAETVEWRPAEAELGVGGTFTFGARRCTRFVRLLLDEVERARCVPVDALVRLAARAASTRNAAAATSDTPHLAVLGPDGRTAVLRGGASTSASSDMGLRLWEAGAFLFLAVSAPPLCADIAGRAVLELGSGLGLTARALATAGAARAVLTDASSAVLDALRVNVRRVAEDAPPPSTELRVARLNVCDAPAVARLSDAHAIDTILAADITYDPALVRCSVVCCHTP